MNELYHIEVYMPNEFISQAKEHQKSIRKVLFSKHLQNHLSGTDFKHNISEQNLILCIRNVVFNPVKPFEVEVENGKVVKYVIRVPYDKQRDISIVVLCEKTQSDNPLIKTAWLNYKNDLHRTLDYSKYRQK